MTDQEVINVVTAHQKGEPIECKLHEEDQWSPKIHEGWNTEEYDYRIVPKPRKPREWDVHILGNGTVTSFPVIQSAIMQTIRVREIIQ